MERSDGDCLSCYPASGPEVACTQWRVAAYDNDDSPFQMNDHGQMMELGAAD